MGAEGDGSWEKIDRPVFGRNGIEHVFVMGFCSAIGVVVTPTANWNRGNNRK